MPGAAWELPMLPPFSVFAELSAKFRVSVPPESKSMAGCPLGAAMFTLFSVMVAVAFSATTIRSLVGVAAPSAMEMMMSAPSLTVSTPLS